MKQYHSETHHRLKGQRHAFLTDYHFVKRLKIVKGLTPSAYICQCWKDEPERFTINPHDPTMGLNISGETVAMQPTPSALTRLTPLLRPWLPHEQGWKAPVLLHRKML